MDLKAMTFLVVGITFAIYIYIAFKSRAASTSEFYVANKGVHPVLNGMATGADWMSAASFISMAGLIAFQGYDASAYLMGWTGGYVLLAMLLAPYLRKYGKFTVPEFIGDRYYSDVGVAQQIERHEAVVGRGLRVLQDLCQLLQVAGAQEVGDVLHRRAGEGG